MTASSTAIEVIGWISTILFLLSILAPKRVHLHALGMLTSITTGVYAYAHDATAIWVKWTIALFINAYMWNRERQAASPETKANPH